MRYLRYLILLSTLFYSSPILAAAAYDDYRASMSGTVMDAETKRPLANANIFLHEIKRWARSDEKGHYEFAALPNGNFTIEVSHIGYKSSVKIVHLQGETVLDFPLTGTIVESDNVTVTGVSSATQLRSVPTHISVITKKELDHSQGTNILDVVSKQPGVNSVTTGPVISKPFIRGLGYNRVVAINDGVRQEGQQWGDEHGLEVDEYSAQKIEILRGPASLMYGSDAIGGVIHILTNIPVPNNIIRANLSSAFNANNRMWGQHANVAGNINGFNWNVYGSNKSAGDYKNKYDGYVLNSRFSEKNFGGYAGVNKSWGYSHLIFSSFNQHIGMVEGERDENGEFVLDGYTMTDEQIKSREVLVPNQKVNHTKLALDNSVSFNNGGRLAALVGFQQNKRREFAEAEHPDEAEAFFDLKTINYNAAYHLPSSGKWKTSFGINGMRQDNTNRGEEAIIPDYNLFDFGVYFYNSLMLNKMTISGGLRYDLRNMNSAEMLDGGEVKFQAFKKNFSNVSASLGLSHELSKAFLLKANISRGFRAPNASELAANGQHEGTMRYEIGNMGLKSENSLSLDGGLQATTLHVDFNVALFHNHINNYIYQERLLTSSGSDSLISGIPAFRFSQQDAKLAGIETGIDIHPHPLDWLHFENTFSFVRGKFLKAVDGSDNLPLIAPARLLTELRAEFHDELKALKNFYVKLEVDNIAAQKKYFAGYNTETATKGYTLLNAGIGTDIEWNGTHLATLMFSVNNLTDRAYQSHLSRLKYLDENPLTGRSGVFNMGRNFTARLIIPMEWKLD